MTTISIQLFQFVPNSFVLSLAIDDIKDNILNSYLLGDQSAKDKDNKLNQQINQAATLSDVYQACEAIEDKRFQAKLMSFITNECFATLQENTSDNTLNTKTIDTNVGGWDNKRRGFVLSDPVTLAQSDTNALIQYRIGYIKFSHFQHASETDKTPVFILQVKNALQFKNQLSIDSFADILTNRPLFLPVRDRIKGFNAIVRSVDLKPLTYNLPKTRGSRQNTISYKDLFIKYKRMSEAEASVLIDSKEKVAIAKVTPYSDYAKHYVYLCRDLDIVASDSLLTLANTIGIDNLPALLADLVTLYGQGKSVLVNDMQNKPQLLSQAATALSHYFNLTDKIDSKHITLQTPRFAFRKDKKTKAGIESDHYHLQANLPKSAYGRLVVAYPNAEIGDADTKQKFLSFITGKSCKVRQANLDFEAFDYSSKLASSEPKKVITRLLKEHPDCRAVLVAWPNYSILQNNKLIEFELMRHGIAVQHVINQGKSKDALKISALIKGIQEKFPTIAVNSLREPVSIDPFDIVIGLDISRHGQEDIASLPICFDNQGNSTCIMSDEHVTPAKEKREVTEIVDAITASVSQHVKYLEQTQSAKAYPKMKILFLRDGVAYEDYDEIAQQLPEYIELTVLSIRKSLLAVASDEISAGEYNAIYTPLTASSFVFGVNARQGSDYKISQVHLVDIVRNPSELPIGQLANVILELVRNNRTTESQMASLPQPVAYADRMAGTIRQFIQDPKLQRYVADHYQDECNAAKGPKRFIYQQIKTFIETHPNGDAFAV